MEVGVQGTDARVRLGIPWWRSEDGKGTRKIERVCRGGQEQEWRREDSGGWPTYL